MAVKKICVIGEFGVGKTSLVRRYVLSEFAETYRATLAVNLYKFADRVETDGGTLNIQLVIWDVEGTAMPTPQTEGYMRGAAGALIVGDVARDDPRQGMMRYAETFERVEPGRPFMFAYNKMDLVDMDAEIEARMGRAALWDRFGADTVTTSALDGSGVVDAFRALAVRIHQLGL